MDACTSLALRFSSPQISNITDFHELLFLSLSLLEGVYCVFLLLYYYIFFILWLVFQPHLEKSDAEFQVKINLKTSL